MRQVDIVLTALLRGERLSRAEAFATYGVQNLTARIADLRLRGEIEVCAEQVKTPFGYMITRWYIPERERKFLLEHGEGQYFRKEGNYYRMIDSKEFSRLMYQKAACAA